MRTYGEGIRLTGTVCRRLPLLQNCEERRESMAIEELLEKCILYFRQYPGFHRVFEKLREKYISLGRWGGTVRVENPTAMERDALTGFLRKDCLRQKSISVSVEAMQKGLDASRFSGLAMGDVLESYFGGSPVSKRDLLQAFEKERQAFFTEWLGRHAGTPAGEWLETAWTRKGHGHRLLLQRYGEDIKALERDLAAVCAALGNLPGMTDKVLRLPVFASEIVKDPHAFDEDRGSGQLLLYALAFLFGMEKPRNAEEKAELYYGAGILVDDVSNYVLCAGLKAYCRREPHPGWEGYYRMKESMQVTLANLGRLSRVESPYRKVYVVENPAVFTALVDRCEAAFHPLICTYGQLNIASLLLLDLLYKEGTEIYYSGDYDPEGLLIADKLKSRYKDHLVLWRFTPEDYGTALSNQAVSQERIKKLERLKDSHLSIVAECVKRTGFAGYQELLIDRLAGDLSC
jgi:uncharacterized protein (TIGR02679 family)